MAWVTSSSFILAVPGFWRALNYSLSSNSRIKSSCRLCFGQWLQEVLSYASGLWVLISHMLSTFDSGCWSYVIYYTGSVIISYLATSNFPILSQLHVGSTPLDSSWIMSGCSQDAIFGRCLILALQCLVDILLPCYHILNLHFELCPT
jgi:hypothetical protein